MNTIGEMKSVHTGSIIATLLLATLVLLLATLAAPAEAKITVSGFDYLDAGNVVAVPLILTGDTFVLRFTLSSDSVAAQFTSIGFAYSNVDNLPTYFSSAAATDFSFFSVFDRNGNLLGQAAPAGPDAQITITNNLSFGGDSGIPAGGSRSFYLTVGTNPTNKQFLIQLKINSSDYNGVIATDTTTAHAITSTRLQVLGISDIDKRGVGKDMTVVGAGAGPFYLFDWTIDNRTSAEAVYKAYAFTCTNVRGFVPGAQADVNLNPFSYTGDIERFILDYGGTSPKSSRRRKKLFTGGWGVSAPSYSIYLTFKDDDDDDDVEPDDASGGLTIAAGTIKEFKFGFYTNAYVSDLPSPGGVVPGDAFYATIDSFRVTITPSPKKYAWVDNRDSGKILPRASYTARTTRIVYEMLGPIWMEHTIAHPHVDYNTTEYNDQSDLDYTSYRPVGGIPITGGPSTTHELRSVKFLITHRPGVDLTVETSPLNPINQTIRSGIQLRRTNDEFYSMADPLYPPDPNLTTITKRSATQTEVDYVIYGGMPLPSDTSLTQKILSQTARIWIGFEPSKHAMLGDSFLISIPTGGIQFKSGLSVYETSSMSLLAAKETYVTTWLILDSTAFAYPLVETAGLTFGLPVIFHDLTYPGQLMPPASAPKALVGFNTWDNRQNASLGALMFFVMDAIDAGGDPVTDNDFRTIANNETSGWAVYRDNDGHPNNTNGQFDPGIDSVVLLWAGGYVPVGNPYASSTLNQYGSGAQPLIVYLEVDPTSTDSGIPDDDLGANLGNDFFLVSRTSPTITPRDKFRVVVGDIQATEINFTAPGLMYRVDSALFRTTPTASVPENFERVFSRGQFLRLDKDTYLDGLHYDTIVGLFDPQNTTFYSGHSSSDNLRTEIVSISGGIAVNVSGLIIGQKNIYRRQEAALFGINAVDTAGGSAVYSILVDVIDSGVYGNFDTQADLAPFASNSITKGYGLAVFQDNGDSHGQFDPGDSVISGIWVTDSASPGFTRFKFIFSPAVDFPDDDIGDSDHGYDYFVVATFGDSLLYQDDVTFRIPENAFVFIPPGVVDQPPAVTTSLMVAGMPVKLLDLPDSGSLTIDGTPIAQIGIMAADTTYIGGGSIFLDKIRLRLEDPTSPGAFPSAILNPLVETDSNSGITIWRDVDGDRKFSALIDAPLLLDLYQWQTTNILEIDVHNDSAPVPDTDPHNIKSETASVFFVVFRAAAIGLDRQLKVSIEGVSEPADPWIKFTAATNGTLTLAPNVLTIAPPGVSGSFTPLVFAPNGALIVDTISVQIAVIPGNSDSSWILSARHIMSGAKIDIGAGKFDSTVLVGRIASPGNPPTFEWPSAFSAGGAFQLSFTYDRAGTQKEFVFGDTLLVDLHCTAPIALNSLPAVTTAMAESISFAADSNLQNADQYAQLAGESGAAYIVYRNGAIYLAGNLDGYSKTLNVNLLAGLNTFDVQLTDLYGNQSPLTPLFTIQQTVGANVTTVSDLLSDTSQRWLGIDETRAVFGINLTQLSANEKVQEITLQLFDSGGFVIGQNIEKLTQTAPYPDTAGIQIYRGVDGVINWAAGPLPMNPPLRNAVWTNGDTITLIPQAPLDVPENDTTSPNMGFDYFIVLRGGRGGFFRDSFQIATPAGAFKFNNDARNNLAAAVTTLPVYTRIPREITDLTPTNDSIQIGATTAWTPLAGINMYDGLRPISADGGALLKSISLEFLVAAGDTFNPSVLEYGIFADTGTTEDTGIFSQVNDLQLTVTPTFYTPTASSSLLRLDITAGQTGIPNTNTGRDSGSDFWIVVRPKVTSLSIDNKFTLRIAPDGIVTTADSPGGSVFLAAKTFTVKAGDASAFLVGPGGTSQNYFNPYGVAGADTLGFIVSPGLPRGWRVYVTRVTDGLVYLDTSGYSDSKTVIIDRTAGGPAAANDSRIMDEYRLYFADSITYPAAASPATIPIDTSLLYTSLFYVDSEALTPKVVKTSQTGATLIVNVLVGDGSELTEKNRVAAHKAERDSFMISYSIRNSANAVRESGTVTSALGATDNSMALALQLTIADTDAYILFKLTDNLGNVSTETRYTDFGALAATGDPQVRLGDLNEPVFRWTPANPNFTFTFPTTATSGRIEIINTAGRRMTLLTADGTNTIVWRNAANSDGSTVKSGIYFLRYDNIVLSNGQRINGRGAILLLK